MQVKQFEQCLMHRKGIVNIRYFIITIAYEALNSNIINIFTTLSETSPTPQSADNSYLKDQIIKIK